MDYLTKQVNAISADAQEKVLRVLESIAWTPENIAECRDIVIAALAEVMPAYTDTAAQAGADFYDAVRETQVGEALGASAVSGYAQEATEGAVRAFVQQIVDGKPVEQFNRSVLGRVDRDVKRAGNVSVAENAARDPLKPRYARVPTGAETCSFCLMLASRGFAYRSREAASHAHPGCDCRVVAGFDGMEVEGYDPDDLYLKWKDPDEWEKKHAMREDGTGSGYAELAGVTRGDPMTFDQANELRANPNFGKEPGYGLNCQTCVVAFEARLRGYDVRALPNDSGHPTLGKLARKTNLAWIDPETGGHPAYIEDESVKNANQAYSWLDSVIEPGNRYTIEFNWKGNGNVGHIISIFRDDDGYMCLYDPQCGKRYSGRDVVTKVYTEDEISRRKLIFGARSKRGKKTQETRNEMLEYLGNLKYEGRISGMKYWCGPRVLRVDNMEFDKGIVDDILESAK